MKSRLAKAVNPQLEEGRVELCVTVGCFDGNPGHDIPINSWIIVLKKINSSDDRHIRGLSRGGYQDRSGVYEIMTSWGKIGWLFGDEIQDV